MSEFELTAEALELPPNLRRWMVGELLESLSGENGDRQAVLERYQSDEARASAVRLRCVQQITEADEETVTIVAAVLSRVAPVSQAARKKERRASTTETAPPKGGGE